MQTFGYKIVDKSSSDIAPVVASALAQDLPLEVGFYYHNAEARDLLSQELTNSGLRVNTHLDHNKLPIYSIHENLDETRANIEASLELGSRYSITHVSAYPMPRRSYIQPKVWQQIEDNLTRLNTLCAEYDYDIHVENTFHNLEFYKHLLSIVTERNLKHIHFCFDLGHAKVWSEQSLPMWVDYLDQIVLQDVRIHFHLHANHGITDDHLSFVEAEEQGITGKDGYTEFWTYYEALRVLMDRFPESRKVFEVKPHIAIQNLNHVKERIAQIPASLFASDKSTQSSSGTA